MTQNLHQKLCQKQEKTVAQPRPFPLGVAAGENEKNHSGSICCKLGALSKMMNQLPKEKEIHEDWAYSGFFHLKNKNTSIAIALQPPKNILQKEGYCTDSEIVTLKENLPAIRM